MEEEEMSLIKFPTYSPDLNPIENLWATLKAEVMMHQIQPNNSKIAYKPIGKS